MAIFLCLTINLDRFDRILLNRGTMTVRFRPAVLYNNFKEQERSLKIMEICTKQYFYEITMVTPAGIRYGSLQLNVNQYDVSGYLEILNHRNSISGKILKNGQCEFTGVLVSLMRKLQYTATGSFDSHSIQLTLKEEKNSYQLCGTAKIGGMDDGIYRNEK